MKCFWLAHDCDRSLLMLSVHHCGRYTHQLGDKQWEYNDWIAATCGSDVPPLPDWRPKMYKVAGLMNAHSLMASNHAGCYVSMILPLCRFVSLKCSRDGLASVMQEIQRGHIQRSTGMSGQKQSSY